MQTKVIKIIPPLSHTALAGYMKADLVSLEYTLHFFVWTCHKERATLILWEYHKPKVLTSSNGSFVVRRNKFRYIEGGRVKKGS